MTITLTRDVPKEQCCGTCCHVRMVGQGGLSSTAGICGSLEDAGYGNLNVVLLDDPAFGRKCGEYRPATISLKGTNDA